MDTIKEIEQKIVELELASAESLDELDVLATTILKNLPANIIADAQSRARHRVQARPELAEGAGKVLLVDFKDDLKCVCDAVDGSMQTAIQSIKKFDHRENEIPNPSKVDVYNWYSGKVTNGVIGTTAEKVVGPVNECFASGPLYSNNSSEFHPFTVTHSLSSYKNTDVEKYTAKWKEYHKLLSNLAGCRRKLQSKNALDTWDSIGSD